MYTIIARFYFNHCVFPPSLYFAARGCVCSLNLSQGGLADQEGRLEIPGKPVLWRQQSVNCDSSSLSSQPGFLGLCSTRVGQKAHGAKMIKEPFLGVAVGVKSFHLKISH